jgi:hypothetical protein
MREREKFIDEEEVVVWIEESGKRKKCHKFHYTAEEK